MKIKFLFILLLINIFYSCNDEKKENSELNKFLTNNFEFNQRILNHNKAKYYNLISDQPSRKNIELEKIDSIFQSLIIEIDNAILNRSGNIKKIKINRDQFLVKIPEIVNNRNEFQISKIESLNSKSNELQLNFIKNEIIIAMSYAFEYNSLITSINESISYFKIDNIEFRKNDNKNVLILSSKYGQRFPENRHIYIKSIKKDNINKQISYNLNDNYSFANIEFNTLEKGNYKINGILKYYERDGEFEIPFEKKFTVK
ncbi:hypothetical protein GFJ94_03020 [Flavobacterium sp. LMO8]|uniref:hypothetical protein n=1 Tax=Flavobacterium sp. LMO8 TaxID=2654244 RepID=UPI001291347C|nr:hypothetical protein [Flavobacterium sp. LMO8]MQP24034.1 hypothetical protein [Flavobacterium sp. LMO8]